MYQKKEIKRFFLLCCFAALILLVQIFSVRVSAVVIPCPITIGDSEGDGYEDDSYCTWGIMSRYPNDGATGVALNDTMSIRWTETTSSTGAGNLFLRDDTAASTTTIACSSLVAGGSSGEFTYAMSLVSGHAYTVTWESNCFNPGIPPYPTAMADTTFWNFTAVVDVTAPLLTSVSPVHMSSGNPTNTNLVMNFNENVVVGTGNVTIYTHPGGPVVQTINIAGPNVTGSGTSTLTVNPPVDLPINIFYVTVDATAVDDVAGNSFAGIGVGAWIFRTVPPPDTTAPICAYTTPADDATGVSTTSNVVLTCDENVQAGIGNIVIHNSDTSVFESIPIGDARVSIVGNVITVNPSGTFAFSSGYYVNFAAGVIEDTSSNAHLALTGTTDWNFTTEALTGWFSSDWIRRVQLTIPAAQVSSDLTDFPVYIDLANLPASFFTNVQSDGADIRVTSNDGLTGLAHELVTLNTGGSTGELYFKARNLSSSTDNIFYIYYDNPNARMINGAEKLGFQNVWSNNYITIYHMEQLPGDANAKIWDSTESRNHGIPNGAMVNGDRQPGKTGSAINFDGTNDYLLINNSPSITTAGGPGQQKTISFWLNTTQLGTAVILERGANGNFTQKMVSGKISAGAGTGANFSNSTTDVNDGTWHLVNFTYDGTNNNVYIDGANLEDSDADTAPAVGIAALTLGSNSTTTEAFDGLLDEVRISNVTRSSAWMGAEYTNVNSPGTFYSIAAEELVTDTSDPKVSYYYPANKSIQHPISHGLKMIFNEVVNIATGDIHIHRSSNDALFETIDVTDGAKVLGSGTNTLSIIPASTFIQGTSYYVLIDYASIEDTISNPYSGIVDKETWTFTIQGDNSIKKNQIHILDGI